ncbi:MAG: hypothetical protein LBJ63_10745 [Prevotellaceae bacterium]|jgi:uncharacterized iron-regulated protein|nr:hypothetical protein [Prevotellaceae bacterium]
MKNRLLIFLCLSFLGLSVFAQNLSNDYKIIHVGKQVKDIGYENPCVSPLENYVARMHLWIEGKYDTIYTELIAAKPQSSKQPYTQKAAELLLNSEIEQVITYKDSIGLVFRKEPGTPDVYLIGFSQLENGKWLGSAEGLCDAENPPKIKQYIENNSVMFLNGLRQYYRQKVVSTDTIAFINYLTQYGKNPKTYLLEKLSEYPLVIYGEFHKRQISWIFLKSLIHEPDFVKNCGTVFMELSHFSQPLFDEFLQNNVLDTALILKILGDDDIYGWQDKGMYEFIQEVWKINQHTNNKIKIIPADFHDNWNNIQTRDDYVSFTRRDRDSTMAEIVYSYLQNKSDDRNCLFIIGQGHAQKSSPSIRITAGTLLKQLTENNPQMRIIATNSHSMKNDNHNWLGKVRYGLFDYVFEKTGNTPIAFDLKNSLFGKEPYDDGLVFGYLYGNYEDFYDGYIFLCPLKEEPYDYELKELYTDDFVEEMKRRANITNQKDVFGIPVDSVTKEKIHDILDSNKQKSNNKRFQIPDNQ